MKKEVIILSEKGWQGVRHLALDLAKKNIPCSVFIKGRPERQYRDFISNKPNIKNYFIPRKVFVLSVVPFLALKKVMGSVDYIVVEKERTRKLVKEAGFKKSIFWLTDIEKKPYYKLHE